MRTKNEDFEEEELDVELEDDELDVEDESLEDEEDLGDDLLDDYYGEGGTPPMEKHKDLLKDLTNFNPYLKDTFNNWLGITWDEKEEKFKPNKLLTPVMSLRGAAWCSGILKTYARNNNIITDISLEEYKNMMVDHIESVWLNLGTRDDFGIIEDGDLIGVANEMEHSAALALMGAGDGKYNKMLGTTFSHHTNGNQGNNQLRNPNVQIRTKEGMLDRLKQKLIGQ